MDTIIKLTREQALKYALSFANIENDEPCCVSDGYGDGLYHFVVRTLFLKYEFYVNEVNGDVVGMNTEPLEDPEVCCVYGCERRLSDVA